MKRTTTDITDDTIRNINVDVIDKSTCCISYTSDTSGGIKDEILRVAKVFDNITTNITNASEMVVEQWSQCYKIKLQIES